MFLYVAILNTVLAFSGRSPAMAVETYSDDLCVKLYRYRRSLDLLVGSQVLDGHLSTRVSLDIYLLERNRVSYCKRDEPVDHVR